jgi:hypothetical protein
VSRWRTAGCLLLAQTIAVGPAMAQQSIRQAAATAGTAAGVAVSEDQSRPERKPLFVSGVILGAAGGTAIILGMTALRTADATSGNAPQGSFAACEALKSDPVYRGNECDVLKGPNKALVIGGVIAAASGVSLAMMGLPNSSISIGPNRWRISHRLSF